MEALTIRPAPKFASQHAYDCARCGRVEVKPVFLSDGHAYGSGCAAVMLGRPRAGRKVLTEAAAVEAAEDRRIAMLADRKARFARALAAFEAGVETGDLDSARSTFFRTGGADKLGPLPVWIARVAESGDLG